MTDDRTLERAARSWLEEGPTQAPHRAVDAALSRIQTTRQERELRLPWRFPTMNRLLLPLAAALIVVIGAAYLLSRPSSNVGPEGSATPAATAKPATPSPTEAPIPTPLAIRESDAGRTLLPGTYHVPFFAAPFEVTLGGGWSVADAMPNNVVFRNENTFLTLVVVNEVYPDPCHLEGGATPVGRGVDALISALDSMKGFEVRDVADASIDTATGKAFTLANAIDLSTAGCTSTEVLSIGTFDNGGTSVDVLFGANSAEPLWVVEVDGTTVLVGATPALIDALDFDGTGLQPIGVAPESDGIAGPIPNGTYQVDLAMTDVRAAMGVPGFSAAERNQVEERLGIGVASILTVRLVISSGAITIEHVVDHGSIASDGTWPTPDIGGGSLGIKYNPTVLGHVFSYIVEWNTDRSAFRLAGGGMSSEVAPVARFMFASLLGMGEFTEVVDS